MNTQERPKELPEQQPKSTYTTPVLVKLGDVKQVTEGSAVPGTDTVAIGSSG